MLKALANILAHGFFGKIYIAGHPYMGGSCIWAANHTSAIVDPAILYGLAPVPLRPVAKHTLWSHPVMRPLLQNVRAIPVYRAQDVLAKGVDAAESDDARRRLNQSAFRASAQALADGDCLMIFPEGISHDDPHLHRVRSGAARMALEAVQRSTRPGFQCVIQPVALDYFEKDEFRSDLGIYLCQPIFVTDPAMKVSDLNEAIEEALKEGLAQFGTWEEKRNCLFLFETAYGRKPHSPREFRNFQELYFPKFQVNSEFMHRTQTMRRLLQAMRVAPSQLIWGETHEERRSFLWIILRHGLSHFLISVPVDLISTATWLIPYRLCAWLAKLTTSERDVVATMKIAHACYLFPLWCAGIGAGLGFFFGDVWPEFGYWSLFATGFCFGALTLLGSLLVSESVSFFPGYWKLARLRFFHPRAWQEVMEEWNTFSEAVFQVIEKHESVDGMSLRQAT